jgi:4-amino-4-deoxy-L-arabinose transferase-like glycosyltransferase
MTPPRLGRALRRSHRRLLVLLATLTIVTALAVHHDVPMDMPDMSSGAVCLAILAVGATVALGAAMVVRPPARPAGRARFGSASSRPRRSDLLRNDR